MLADQVGEGAEHRHGLPDHGLHGGVEPAGLGLGRVLREQGQLGVGPGPAQGEPPVGQAEQATQVRGVLADRLQPGRRGLRNAQQSLRRGGADAVGGAQVEWAAQPDDGVQGGVVHLGPAGADRPASSPRAAIS